MSFKIKQRGNYLTVKDGDNETQTLTLPKGYDTDLIFSLAYKANDGSELAGRLLRKEFIHLSGKPEAPVVINETRVKKKLLDKKVKLIKSLKVEDLPINLPENWLALMADVKENKDHIKNFLIWLALNDNKYTRENFLKHFKDSVPYITPNGFIVSVRQVWKRETDASNALYDFVQSEAVKVKAWKKSPKNFEVYETTDEVSGKPKYTLYKVEAKEKLGVLLGTLDVLKESTPKPERETTYYSNYAKITAGIAKETWKVGEIAEIHEKGTHQNICGINQLHIRTNPLDTGNRGYGDVSIITIVNPKDVINIQHGWKYTTSRMYIAAEITEAEISENFVQSFGRFDFDYMQLDMQDLLKLDQKRILDQVKDEIKVLNNKRDHIEPELFSEIIKSRIQLVNK